MKKYFDEKHEIVGWIIAVLGLALGIVAMVMDAVPTMEVIGVAGVMVVVGATTVAEKFRRFATAVVDLLERIATQLEKQGDVNKSDSES